MPEKEKAGFVPRPFFKTRKSCDRLRIGSAYRDESSLSRLPQSRRSLLTPHNVGEGVVTMPIFVISYDLNKAKNYPKLLDELRRLHCVRVLESVWVGDLNGTPDAVVKHLTPFVDGDDSLMAAETNAAKIAFKRPFEGAYEWIKEKRA